MSWFDNNSLFAVFSFLLLISPLIILSIAICICRFQKINIQLKIEIICIILIIYIIILAKPIYLMLEEGIIDWMLVMLFYVPFGFIISLPYLFLIILILYSIVNKKKVTCNSRFFVISLIILIVLFILSCLTIQFVEKL